MNRVVYQYYTLKMRKRKGGNLQISSTMVFFPLYFIMDSGYTNEVSVYKLYLLGVNLSVIGRVLGQAFLRTTSPSRLRRATSPGRGGFGSPRKVNGFARGSPTRGAVCEADGEVVLRQRLSFAEKFGSWHRFLYLFAEVYGILVLRPCPPIDT